jgi:hypothetical protein
MSLGIALLAAAACHPLPAGPADEVKPARDDDERAVLCVRAGGRRVVLRRGTATRRLGGAAASGRRVAWIETRFHGGRRRVVVTVVRVAAEGRPKLLRRDTVHRDQRRSAPWLDVAITARGELAWLEPTSRGSSGRKRIVVDLPSAPPHTAATGSATRLTVEDGFTLRWMDIANGLHFRDLPRPRTGCPERSRYRVVEENDLVRVTQGLYYGRLIQVLRACVKASGRERVIAQENEGIGSGTWDAVFGLDRHWILLGRQSFDRYDACAGGVEIFPMDARTRRRGRTASLRWCPEGAPFPAPDTPVAVTARGIAAWLSGEAGDGRLVYAAPGGRAEELDRGAIAGLEARGTSVDWTNSGAPRSMELP